MSVKESGDLHFHSSREERLAGREQPEKVNGGVFAGNRSLLIIMLDVLLVLLMFVIYLLFFGPEAGVRVEGFRIEGSGFAFGEDLYLTVTIEAAEAIPAASGEATLVRVEFADGTSVTDVLPTDPDFPVSVRHVFPAGALPSPADPENASVSVYLLGRSVELSVPID